jgi:SAM-dependent methyltransferase
MSTTPARTLDTQELEQRVKHMYQEVALQPEREFHFETGRVLAERLGYPPADLDRIPAAAIDSFAGVGHFLDLADIAPGDTVLDLGSGSGMDSFLASLAAAPDGRVIGVDMTDEQLAKAKRLAAEAGIENAEFRSGYIEDPPVEADSVDCVISNGVINLSPDKAAVFAAAGLQIAEWRESEQYRFMSERADNACANTASRASRCSRGALRGGTDGR